MVYNGNFPQEETTLFIYVAKPVVCSLTMGYTTVHWIHGANEYVDGCVCY